MLDIIGSLKRRKCAAVRKGRENPKRGGGKVPAVEISRRLINLFGIAPQRPVSHCPAPASHRVVGLVATTDGTGRKKRRKPPKKISSQPSGKERKYIYVCIEMKIYTFLLFLNVGEEKGGGEARKKRANQLQQ